MSKAQATSYLELLVERQREVSRSLVREAARDILGRERYALLQLPENATSEQILEAVEANMWSVPTMKDAK